MTKKEFVSLFAEKGGYTKKDAEKAINIFLDSVESVLVKGNSVTFVGWGKWEVVKRAAREVVNPQTKKRMKIKAKKAVKFKIGKTLAEKVKKA